MTTRTTCGACAGSQLQVFLDLGKTPLANKFPATADEDETWYPLALGRCGNCGLVQNMEIIPDEEIYGDDYGFFSGGSQAQLNYHARGATLLLNRHRAQAKRFTVEVACNDGSLLKHFARAGCKVLGVDPALPAQQAIDEGMPVLQKSFTAALAREIRDEHGPAGLVIAYNSMAHVGDLSDVLTGVWALLAPDGVAVVEVQYLPDLLVGGLYDQIYHEHRYFYSLTSFKHAAELHGLYVIDAELIELQGGGIRFTLSIDPDIPLTRRMKLLLYREEWLSLAGTYEGFQGRIDRMRDHLLQLLEHEIGAHYVVAGYAAAAKATTILNYCGIGPKEIPFVIDTTPYKQGRFVPGVKIPIVAEGHADVRLLLAPNYLAHVLRNDPHFLAQGGRWLVPIPAPQVI